MSIDNKLVGYQIQSFRKIKGLTQLQLAERLGLTSQAVSKWECGENLPDVEILLLLSEEFDTTIDQILNGGNRVMKYKGKKSMEEIRNGVDCLSQMGRCLGK